MLTCTSCGDREPTGSAFCGNCGAPFAVPDPKPPLETSRSTGATSAEVLRCTSCGNEEPKGSEFCGNCGAAFAPARADPDQTALIEPAATDVPDPEGTDSWQEPVPPVAPPPPVPHALTASERWGWRSRPYVLMAAPLLIAGVAAAVVFGTGLVGGSSGKLESTFLRQVNVGALGPLSSAVQTAAQDAGATDGGFARGGDGGRIVQVANDGSLYLRGLNGLSGRQKDEVRLLLAFVAASGRYGQAFGSYRSDDSQSRLALDDAVTAVRSARGRVESAVPTGLQLPSQRAFVSSQAIAPPPPPPATTATPPTSATAYVQHVDQLLGQSHAVVVSLGSFVPRAAHDKISRTEAVSAARSYLSQRQLEVTRAQALSAPPAFAQAQELLIRALQASAADDKALVAWTVARRDGSGNAQAAFTHANRLGARATALKQQFLRVYGQQRQIATGRRPASLPNIF
jgi:hypothetical protein